MNTWISTNIVTSQLDTSYFAIALPVSPYLPLNPLQSSLYTLLIQLHLQQHCPALDFVDCFTSPTAVIHPRVPKQRALTFEVFKK